jgi:hypothetical protein
MLIRMTEMGTHIAALFAGVAVAAGGLLGDSSDDRVDASPRNALVIDAAAARDGRDLVDDRLRTLEAEIRLPRTAAEARTDLRYLAAQGYRIVAAGPGAAEAARATGVAAERTADLAGALAAVSR